MVNKYSAAKKLLEERKFEEAITAFEALGDYQDSPEQMERAQLAADYEAAKTLLEAGKNKIVSSVPVNSLCLPKMRWTAWTAVCWNYTARPQRMPNRG